MSRSCSVERQQRQNHVQKVDKQQAAEEIEKD
jgi:hypothetical protein